MTEEKKKIKLRELLAKSIEEHDYAKDDFYKLVNELRYGKPGEVKDLTIDRTSLPFEEFRTKLKAILDSDERFSIKYLKKKDYWGIFDSMYTEKLPKEFREKFEENGYEGDNEELLYRLFYLDSYFSSLMADDREEFDKIIEECITLEK